MSNATEQAAQTAEPLQYVSDLIDSIADPNPEARTITDPAEAAGLIADETRSRIGAVLERFGGTPAVLLSGGVDSIYVAAVAVALGAEPVAVTASPRAGTRKRTRRWPRRRSDCAMTSSSSARMTSSGSPAR